MRIESIAAHAAYTPERAPETAAALIGQHPGDGPQLTPPVVRGKASAVADRDGCGQPRRAGRA